MGFYEQISKYYDYIFPAENTQLDFIRKQAGEPPKKVLDAACGSGEYSVRLAIDGYDVTAVDIDQAMVDAAKEKAVINNVKTDVLKADLKTIGNTLSGKSFDFIFCIGNSIVHLDDLQEIEASIRQMYDLLQPGGILLLQIVNFDRVLKNSISALPTLRNEKVGLEFIRNYRWLEEKQKISFDTILTVQENSRSVRYENSVELRPLLRDDLYKMLVNAGFNDIQLYGDFSGTVYDDQSFLLITSGVKNK